MKYMEFERVTKRRVVNRYDMAEYSLLTLILAAAAALSMIAFFLLLALVEKIGEVLF